MLAGDLAAAEDIYRQYEVAAVESGAVQHQISALRFLGYLSLYARKYTEAASALDRALELSEITGERSGRVRDG
jgi:hypothetical protein